MRLNSRLLYTSSALKITACILGYSLWSIASSWQPMNMWLTVPVCFYNTSANSGVDAQEEVRIQLRGPRALLRQCHDALAAHIDATLLHEGVNKITLSSAMLFLPQGVYVVAQLPTILDVNMITASARTA